MIDWEGKAYDFILTRKKYSVKWKQRWTDYKKWGDFGGKWKAKAEVYYTEEDLLKEIREPCYKFLEWNLESGLGEGWSGLGEGWKCNWKFAENKFFGFFVVEGCELTTFTGLNMVIDPTGTKLYFQCDYYLHEYTLDSPYDLSSMSLSAKKINLLHLLYEISSSISGYEWRHNPRLFFYFRKDGKILYVCDYTDFFQFNLSVPWDISTIEYANKYIRFNENSIPPYPERQYLYGLSLSSDGSILYVYGGYAIYGGYPDNLMFYQCSLSTPWDITTISSIEEIPALVPALSVAASTFKLDFRPDGMVLYSHYHGGYVTYNLTTPWDARTAIPGDDCSFYDYHLIPQCYIYNMCFSYDGLYYFVMCQDIQTIYKFVAKK